MNEQATILFNIFSSCSGERAGKANFSPLSASLQPSLCAVLTRGLYAQKGFKLLGRQLETLLRQAYSARQTEVMKEASQLMLALPLSKELKSAARYYQAIYAWKQGNVDEARQMLGDIIDQAHPQYQAQGLLTLGTTYLGQGNPETASPCYLAAARIAGAHDLQTYITAQRMIAVVRSVYGDHQHALDDLERLFPFVRAIARHYPTCYYDFLNSYAIELGEVGRLTEAQNVCAVTLRSPFAPVYPEYSQTREELAAKRTTATPVVIAVPVAPETVSSSQAQVEPQTEPARARSTISLVLRRPGSLARLLTKREAPSAGVAVRPRVILDWLVEPALPRGPPALS